MQETAHIDAARRTLFDKLLRGEVAPMRNEISRAGRHPDGSPVPLSYNQEQVYLQAQLAARLAPDSRPHHETTTIQRSGLLDVQALERSLMEILRRHEAWRTTFEPLDGVVVQRVQAMPDLRLEALDLRKIPEPDRERTALTIAERYAQEPFDLARGPLVRFQLVRLDEQEYRLFLTAHQIVTDGVSVSQVFFPELVALYEAFVSGEASPLAEPKVQYSEYAQWQRETLENRSTLEHLHYWQKQLSGLDHALRLPTDRPRPAIQTFRGTILPFALPRSLSESARALARAEETTLFVTLLAAFAALLSRYTGQEEIVIGTLSHTRNSSEVLRILGYFLNPVVLGLRLTGDPSFRDILTRTREVLLSALSHDELPFQQLVAATKSDADLSRHPLYQVQFSLGPPVPEYTGWNLTPMDVQGGGAKLDLYFELDDRPDGTLGRVQYNPDLFDAATIRRMVRHYEMLLETVLADPDQRLAELPQFADTPVKC
jgi:surfactin family lipopeptide synthetase A